MAWAMLLELGMMVGPPMGPMVGLFGVRYAWPQLFLLTLVAHVAFGTALGLLTQSLLKEEDRGVFLSFLTGTDPGARRTVSWCFALKIAGFCACLTRLVDWEKNRPN